MSGQWLEMRTGLFILLAKIQPLKSESELPVQIAGTSSSTPKHYSQLSPRGLLAKGVKTSSSFAGQNFQQLCGPELPAIAETSSNFVGQNFQQLLELSATLRAETSSNFAGQNFQHFLKLPAGEILQSATKCS
jgi:hypothetical protein